MPKRSSIRFLSCVPEVSAASTLLVMLLLWLGGSVPALAQGHLPDASDQAAWHHRLRQKYFGNRPIADGKSVIKLNAPVYAEDPSVVPITITDLLAGRSDKRIDKLWLIIDNNPRPMSARFDFGPAAANATIATRVRVNTYTNMRVIAETNDHHLYMVRRFVKASGGCSAPVSRDPKQALKHLGEMRLRPLETQSNRAAIRRVQLMIRHPNITGLQMNQLTRLVPLAHYVDAITVHKGDALVFDSHMTFSLSENPSLRFNYRDTPDDAGDLSVRVHDNKNNVFEQRWASSDVRPAPPEEKQS